MSKVDAMRAIKDARRAEAIKAAGTAAPTPVRTPAAASEPAATARPKAAAPAPESDGACGHRSMNGRTCTRPGGHAEKNHRYG